MCVLYFKGYFDAFNYCLRNLLRKRRRARGMQMKNTHKPPLYLGELKCKFTVQQRCDSNWLQSKAKQFFWRKSNLMKPQYLSAIFNIHIMKSPGGLFIISTARKRRRKRKFTFFHNENRSGLPPLKVYVNLLMKQPVCISPYYGNFRH